MRVLVVFCHPDETSFASASHRVVRESLGEAGHEVIDLDLYAEGFRPVLSLHERIEYSDPAYRHSVDKYARQLASVEGFVAVYPTWWYGMPAMLKGYFDRVWAPGIAYDVKDDGGIDTGRLAHIRRLAVVTTYGASWWVIRCYMGDPERKFWSRGVRALCGRGCELDWLARYDMDRASPERLDAFLDRVRRAMRRW